MVSDGQFYVLQAFVFFTGAVILGSLGLAFQEAAFSRAEAFAWNMALVWSILGLVSLPFMRTALMNAASRLTGRATNGK